MHPAERAAEGGRLIVRLDDDKTLGRELRTYLQTDKYVGRKNYGTASTTTLKILRERQEESRECRQRLVLQLEQLCKEAGYYAVGQPVQPKSGTAVAALQRMKEILGAAAPYGVIKDVASLIRTVEGVNTALVTK